MMRTKVISSTYPPKIKEIPTKPMASNQTLAGNSPGATKPTIGSSPNPMKSPNSARPSTAEKFNAIPNSSQSTNSSSQPTMNKEITPSSKQAPPSSYSTPTMSAARASIPKHKTKRLPSLSKPQALVKFIVGTGAEEQTFVIHKNFATFHSPVFAAAFKSGNGHVESESGTMRLPDVKAENFGTVAHWLYTRDLEEDDEVVGGKSATLSNLCAIWDLAFDFRITDLQNTVMFEIIQLVKAGEGQEILTFIETVYRGPKLGRTPLKKLAIDKLTWGTEPEILMDLNKRIIQSTLSPNPHWLPDLWADVALAFSKHYWDGIPGKYFREWGVREDYMVSKNVSENEDKHPAILE